MVRVEPPACPSGMSTGAPDFIGIGAQKAGTSWWYSLITDHPSVMRPDERHKELHYFTRFGADAFGEEEEEDYWRWFPRQPGTIVGEWTPEYMNRFWIPPLIARAAPEAKLLVMLRDPVDRYRSGVRHYEERSGKASAMVLTDAFSRGQYHRLLSHLWQHLPRERTLVLQYERCVRQPKSELIRTFRFLGIDESHSPTNIRHGVNLSRSSTSALPAHIVELLVQRYREDVERLVDSLAEIDLSLWPHFA